MAQLTEIGFHRRRRRKHMFPSLLRACRSSRVARCPPQGLFRYTNRYVSSAVPGNGVVSTELQYAERGAPNAVLKLVDTPLPPPTGSQVLVKFLAAPINPADINMIEGVYSILPELPAVGGNEGVAEVLATGPGVSTLKAGDRVIPATAGSGTWRTNGVFEEGELDTISDQLSLENAATIAVNPCTAYRMMKDFVALKPGDIIVQNGATSAVGRAVIQLAKAQGVRTINFVRDRPDPEEWQRTEQALRALGADVVIKDDNGKSNVREILKSSSLASSTAAAASSAPGSGSVPKAVLGFNCVGGSSSLQLSKLMANEGTMVTYGGMSRRPVQVPTGKFIFNDLIYRGFWLTRWVNTHSKAERQTMIDELSALMIAGKLHSEADFHPIEAYAEALATAQSSYKARKQLFKFE